MKEGCRIKSPVTEPPRNGMNERLDTGKNQFMKKSS